MTLSPGTYILAFDPGETTGVAAGEYISGRNFNVLESTEVKWAVRFAATRELLQKYKNAADNRGVELIIVSELFLVYPNMIQALAYHKCESAQVEGIIETYCHELSLPMPVYQKASERKAVDVLNAHFPLVRGSDHKIDSYQHLRLYILRNRMLEAKRQ